jgi:tetratricopeptide (TPR) repeat protein
MTSARTALGASPPAPKGVLPELPVALRRGERAEAYLAAERGSDHRRAAAGAVAAMERAIAAEEWWPADVWAHRALWHFEQAQATLHAARQARRIGDLRAAAGDPDSARRYYAEAIDEARDIGAEHEQGLAALGLGRSLLEMGDVTGARRLAGAAVELLGRARAPAGEIAAARGLLGSEVAVGPAPGEEEG